MSLSSLFPHGPETPECIPEILSFLDIKQMTEMAVVCKSFSKSLSAAILIRQRFSRDEYRKMLDLHSGVGPNILFQMVNSPGINFQYEIPSYIGKHDVLIYSCYKGFKKTVTCLLYHIKHPSSRSIVWAAYNNHIDLVTQLMEDSRIDPSFDHNCALRLAVSEGHLEMVKCLMQHEKVDPSDLGNNALDLAIKYKRTDVLNFLVEDPRMDLTDRLNEILTLLKGKEKKGKVLK